MEYYAKSLKQPLSVEEKEKIAHLLERLQCEWFSELNEKEISVIKNEIRKLDKDILEEQTTLKQHEEEIVRCAEHFFEQFGGYFTEKEKQLVLQACKQHDVGKANLLFQAVVNPKACEVQGIKRKNIPQIPHGFLSALSISKSSFLQLSEAFTESDFDAFITAIYYHHARLDDYDSDKIKEYCKNYFEKNVKEYLGLERWKTYTFNLEKLLFRNNIFSEYKYHEQKYEQYVVVKGLLNKFDYCVSAGYTEAEQYSDLVGKQLSSNVKQVLADYGLRPVQKYMLEKTEENLIIVAPTGSGKTEAALLWMNGEKGFYTLPLKVSSNAIYDRIRENYSYDKAAILHSDSMPKYLEEYGDSENGAYEYYERAKMLSAPLTVCTVDQLFKFVYKALGTEIFAATLKYSKIVVDEIQAYSPRVIATIIYGLKTINNLGGHFAIVTATFPPVLEYFMKKYGLIRGKQYQYCDFSDTAETIRHKIKIQYEEFELKKIVEQGTSKKVLIICNTVSKAQDLYEKLCSQVENVYLLHSRYIRKDRAVLEKAIMSFSNDKNAFGMWITTQIVEASLDIDFDILYTEMSTADSLLQRMGRCNRKGRYHPQEANIIVLANQNGVGKGSVYEKIIYERSLVYLTPYENVLFSEKMKVEYINKVYSVEEAKESGYYKEIERYLALFDTVNPLDFTKKEADEQFRSIRSITVVPESVYLEQQELFEMAVNILETPHISKEIKSMLKAKIEDYTLALNLYSDRLPHGVDKAVIGQKRGSKGTEIHRTQMRYEFDSESLAGRGLLLNDLEDEMYML